MAEDRRWMDGQIGEAGSEVEEAAREWVCRE